MSKQTDLINVTDAITVSGSNVGIGTSSPTINLHVAGGAGGIRYASSSGASTLLYSDTNAGYLGTENNYPVIIQQNNAERMRIDSSGNVGIGGAAATASGYSKYLHVQATSTGSSLHLTDGTSGHAASDGFELLSYNGTAYVIQRENNPLLFYTNDTERMRIDASGIVMVATTDTNPHTFTTGSGLSINSAAMLNVAKQAAVVQILNRTGNSDGVIQEYKKDGTTVGSIGVAQSGDRTYFSGGSYGVASDTSEATIMPCGTTGTGNDGVVSLGKSDARFKDAYLSGGIYLGGVGSANKLEDYEEGTWTPQLSSDVSITSYTILNGYYTKVGRLVTVSATVQAASLGSWSGASIGLYGLPFTVSNDSNNEAVGTLAMRGTTGDKDGLYIRFIQNGTYMRLEHRTGYQSHDPNMPANTIDTGTKIYVTGSYFVA